ncbi:MoxR family ATPase [Labilibaculum sp. DW002]|uniref:MoxR family ATPase n=1 Tax=Paralabilibaculum antarcticum TaxID=2912572 RepID=A0ABT5VPD0_9BACT|nr:MULTISPECIES: MoxR family ATPase [unclassified Labilibaculum]MBI9059710.1 MoxR family ATPase [Labilibaculum sp.]MDE5417295.1 MoxR family ATPase [Labilibaculum sp. DW002]
MENKPQFKNRIDLAELNHLIGQIKYEIKKVIIGQEKNIDLLLVGLFAQGHVLIEGVPGIAKTLSAKLLAKSISSDFSRIQFTPDLMPSDVLGTTIFNLSTSKFEFNKGPIFSNIILIDEINRAPAKTQSALFEVMEEAQISIDGTTHEMEQPFWVIATQNPIEQEGTYRLPEAQLDRFLMKIEFTYPDELEELEILATKNERKGKNETASISEVLNSEQINELRHQVQEIHIEENLQKYIVQIVQSTRNHPGIILGASPRASVAVMMASKALSAIRGRDFVTPDDIKEVVIPALHHRLILTPEKEMEGVLPKQIIAQIIEGIEIPR